MSSGETYEVCHPEMAMLTRTDILVGVGEMDEGVPADFHICSLLHVTTVEPFFSLGASVFATKLDDALQEHLSRFGIEWRFLEERAQFNTEAVWRSIFGEAFRGRPRLRRGSKAVHEYLQQPCRHYLIVPFTSNVEGTPMHVHRRPVIGAYECRGDLVSLGEFCDAEFFVAPTDFEWTLVHTHEDYAIDGPYFIRREWGGE